MSLRIVVVEDNQLVLEELVVRLNLEGYQASGVDCGESLDQVFQRERVDLLIVDLNLPQEDGLGVIERVRRASPRIRIIILTARSTPSDKEQGYLAGADLYLVKPVRIRELLAAITSLHRRLQEVENVSQRDWLLFTDEWLLETPSGISLQLTAGETSLLQCLALSPKQTASMNSLLDHLAVASDPDGRNLLMVKVSRLRKKLEAVAKEEETIRSIRHEGYRLCLPVQLHYRS